MTARDEANIVLAGLLDGASHADCESCRDVMRRAHRLLTDGHELARLAIEQGAFTRIETPSGPVYRVVEP